MALSPDLTRIYTQAPADQWAVETVELTHPAFDAPYLLVNEPQPLTATLEDGRTVTFTPTPFLIQLPEGRASGPTPLSFTIDTLGGLVVEQLEKALEPPLKPIMLTYRVFTTGDLTAPASDPIELALTEIEATAEAVVGQAAFVNLLDRRFPTVVYTPTLYPGLDR
jgi:hypothetical protein